MRPGRSLQCSKEPIAGQFPEPDEFSNPRHSLFFSKIYFNIILPRKIDFPETTLLLVPLTEILDVSL
jgi:hypothetical protein